MAPPPDGANDVIAEAFTGHAFDLIRLEAGQRQDVRRMLQKLEDDLVSLLARIDPTGVERESYRAKRLDNLLVQVRETIRASYRSTAREFATAMRDLAEIEDEFVARAVNRGIGLDLMTPQLTRTQAVALVGDVLVQGAPLADWWQRQAGDVLQRFTDEMRRGMAQGETNAQLIRRIRGGTQNGEPVVGFMSVTRQHAESLVRSATHAVAEAARQATYEANIDVIQAVVWTATLDTRTTLMCAARDGKRYDAVTHKPIGHTLPWGGGPGNLHWGCRSSSRPETKSWQDLGIDVANLPPGTRASMNGQVAADLTFEAWLQKRGQAEQDAVLGAGRAQLWRDGRVSFRDLLDQNGRPLTLDELRQRVRS